MPDKKKSDRELAGEKKPIVSRLSDIVFPDKFRERVVNATYPYGYTPDPVGFLAGYMVAGEKKEPVRLNTEKKSNRNRHDALRMYSDLPQKYETFESSEYKPSQGKDSKNSKTRYYKFKDLNLEDKYKNAAASFGLLDKEPGSNMNFSDTGNYGNSVMNTGTLGYDEDEKGKYISYYDKWDLAGKDEVPGLKNVFGRPFNIYNRIYLDDKEIGELKKKYKNKVSPHLTQADINLKDATNPKKLIQ